MIEKLLSKMLGALLFITGFAWLILRNEKKAAENAFIEATYHSEKADFEKSKQAEKKVIEIRDKTAGDTANDIANRMLERAKKR